MQVSSYPKAKSPHQSRKGCLTFSHMRQFHQELIQLLLSLGKLTTPTVINPKTIHDTVNDQQPIITGRKFATEQIEQFKLMLAVQGTGIRNVLLRGVRVHTEAFGDLGDSFRAKGSFRIDVGYFAVCSAEGSGELSDDGHCVGELGFAAAELAEDFADAHALEAAGSRQYGR
jgi:hypothetical protein